MIIWLLLLNFRISLANNAIASLKVDLMTIDERTNCQFCIQFVANRHLFPEK